MVVIGAGVILAVLAGLAVAGDPGPSTALPAAAVAAGLVAAVAGGSSLAALRAAEVAVFGGAAALIVTTGYAAAEAGDPSGAWRTATLQAAVLAAAHGVLVPGAPARTAAGAILLGAASPVLLIMLAAGDDAVYAPIRAAGVALPLVLLGLAVAVGIAGGALMSTFSRIAVETRDSDMYKLVEKIGSGGMGEIWRADHHRLSRPAAIKLIRPDKLCDDPAKAKELICRFEIEAKSTALLRSPFTVEVYDYGTTSNGTFYYVMEYLDGLDLQRLVDRHGPLAAPRVISLVEQVCRSMCEAHAQGLIHRDIKPANIFVGTLGSSYDHIKVLDFGLARPVERAAEAPGISRTDELLGTPAYMAPELIRGGDDIDTRADIYAIGCVAYFLLTGRMVFDADSSLAMAIAHVSEDPVPLSRRGADVPGDLEQVVMRCLAKQPSERYASCLELIAALRRCADHGAWSDEEAASWWAENAEEPASSASLGLATTAAS